MKKIIFCILLIVNHTVFAKSNSLPKNLIEQYSELFKQQEKNFKKQQQLITEQGKEIEKLKSRLDNLTKKTTKPKHSKKKTPLPPLQAAINKHKTKMPAKPVGKAPPVTIEEKRPPEIPRVSDNVGGVLTRKGNLAIEPSLQYAFSDNNRIFLDGVTVAPAAAIGLIDIRRVKRHTVTANLTARYGLTNRMELEFKIPYSYRSDSQRSRPVAIEASADEIFNADGNDIGDLELSARYQFNDAGSRWPIFIGNMTSTIPTGKSPFKINFEQSTAGASFPTELPTGSGYYSFQPSISALYPTDPAVFFANVAYNYNLETNERMGKVDPGDGISGSFGMGFALNETSSFSLGYSHKHIFNTEINGEEVIGSTLDIGQLLLGYSYKISPKTNINFSVGIGATSDAQDVRLKLRLPLTFDFLSEKSN
ncbi:MAG: transporter [Methylococcaceae bacterium]